MNINEYASVTAKAPHHAVSEKYAFIPTTQVLEVLGREGWQPADITEKRAMSPWRVGFQKHVIRLRHGNYPMIPELGDLFPELMLTNSHDRSSAFILDLAMRVKVCSNGLIIGDSTESMRVRHVGYTSESILEAVFSLTAKLPEKIDCIKEWDSIILTEQERTAFATSALDIRWEENSKKPSPHELLIRHRYGDKPSLWSTYNTVQENMTKGVKKDRKRGRQGFRRVTGVDTDTKMNRALWTLATEMAKIKQS